MPEINTIREVLLRRLKRDVQFCVQKFPSGLATLVYFLLKSIVALCLYLKIAIFPVTKKFCFMYMRYLCMHKHNIVSSLNHQISGCISGQSSCADVLFVLDTSDGAGRDRNGAGPMLQFMKSVASLVNQGCSSSNVCIYCTYLS